jgi:hypothetical protein
MANITLTVIVDKLDNEEVDAISDKVEKILTDATQVGKLAGKVTEVSELDREEDEVEEEEQDE